VVERRSQAASKSPLHYVGRGFRGGANTTRRITLPISTILTYLSTPDLCVERGLNRKMTPLSVYGEEARW